MNPAIEITQADASKALIAGTKVSLLCVSGLGVYLFSPDSIEEVLLLLSAPFSLHTISLYLLLRKPGNTAVLWAIVVATSGTVAMALLLPVFILDWAMGNNPLTPILGLIYAACQVWTIYRGIQWKKAAGSSSPQ